MNIITVSGASGSGKTTVARYICEKYKNNCLLISIDNYYFSEEEQLNRNGFIDFDNPSSIDIDLLKKNLTELQTVGRAKMPIYCFEKHMRIGYKEIRKKELLIIEGIYANFYELSTYSKNNIYINVDLDIALLRRLQRDIIERGREIKDVLNQYLNYVRPAYLQYNKKIRKMSDIIINNNSSIEMLLADVDEVLNAYESY